MVLSDRTIKEMLQTGELVIEGADDTQIQPASVDIRLGDTFSVFENSPDGIIRFSSKPDYKTVKSDTFLLLPGHFVLATTREYISLPSNVTAFVEGRSSIGRLGLFVQNAGWVDPGFEGEITLELFNAGSNAIELKSGQRVGQLVFEKMDRSAENPYHGKYQRQTGATGSRIHLDAEHSTEDWRANKCVDESMPFVKVYADLMVHPSYCNLNTGARQLYIAMLLESMGKPEFEFPMSIAKKYGIAGRTLVDSVKRLMESGFIKVIASGKNTREPSRYSFSSAWKESPGNQ